MQSPENMADERRTGDGQSGKCHLGESHRRKLPKEYKSMAANGPLRNEGELGGDYGVPSAEVSPISHG